MHEKSTALSLLAISTAIVALVCVVILSYVGRRTGVSSDVVSPVHLATSTPVITSYCTANDLTGSAEWYTNQDGSLGGRMKIVNSSSHPCSLSSDSQLSVLSGGRILPIVFGNQMEKGSYIDIESGQSTFISFTWSNWCGTRSSYNKSVRLVLPRNAGYVEAPVIDSLGRALSNMPRCDSSSSVSTLTIAK